MGRSRNSGSSRNREARERWLIANRKKPRSTGKRFFLPCEMIASGRLKGTQYFLFISTGRVPVRASYILERKRRDAFIRSTFAVSKANSTRLPLLRSKIRRSRILNPRTILELLSQFRLLPAVLIRNTNTRR